MSILDNVIVGKDITGRIDDDTRALGDSFDPFVLGF